jgi:hypothetical protein
MPFSLHELTQSTTADRLFWSRHANPLSGWSRFAAFPLVMYALYERRWRLAAGTVLFIVVNPVLFAPPTDVDNWMSKVVLGERLWIQHGDGSREYNAYNVAGMIAFVYGLYAIYRRYTLRAAVCTLAVMVFKLLFVDEMVRFYEDHHLDLDDHLFAFETTDSSA